MRSMLTAVLWSAVLAGPLAARQIPPGLGQVPTVPPEVLDPNPTKVHGCLRPDAQKNIANIKAAMAQPRKAGETPPEVTEAQKKVAGCAYYRITLESKIQVDDTELPGLSSTISGKGSIVFGLAPDNSRKDYDFTSGIQDLTAPIEWTAGSADITRPKCEVTITPLPYTLFAFWLGVTDTPDSRVGVRITPSGNELHPIEIRCKDDLGRWSKRVPSKESIFAPAWIKLHGEGQIAAPQTADQKAVVAATNSLGKGGTPAPPKLSSPTGSGIDMAKLMAMNPADLEAMAAKLNPNDPKDMAKLGALVRSVVPNADAQLAAAQDNFMFSCPAMKTVANAWQCRITQDRKVMADRTGYGTIKAISEETVITIERVNTPPGGP